MRRLTVAIARSDFRHPLGKLHVPAKFYTMENKGLSDEHIEVTSDLDELLYYLYNFIRAETSKREICVKEILKHQAIVPKAWKRTSAVRCQRALKVNLAFKKVALKEGFTSTEVKSQISSWSPQDGAQQFVENSGGTARNWIIVTKTIDHKDQLLEVNLVCNHIQKLSRDALTKMGINPDWKHLFSSFTLDEDEILVLNGPKYLKFTAQEVSKYVPLD